LVGASSVAQLNDNVVALKNMEFSKTELQQIEVILSGEVFDPLGFKPKESLIDWVDGDKPSSRSDFIQSLAKRLGGTNLA